MYKRILVATDGSALSKKATSTGIDLAVATGAELVVLKVIPRYPVSYFEGAVALVPAEAKRIERQWTAEGEAVVAAVRTAAEKKGVMAKAITVRSDLVAEAIVTSAKKHKCDLIIMASHGYKGIKRILLGSETQHVLTQSPVPVLVLR